MTNKTMMPGPVAWFEKTADRNWFLAYSFNPTSVTKPLITTDQAEAYADARVREALEEAANSVADPAYIEAAIENFVWADHGNYVRAHQILRDAVESIRALTPTK